MRFVSSAEARSTTPWADIDDILEGDDDDDCETDAIRWWTSRVDDGGDWRSGATV